ncbi:MULTISPECIES: hypothetical protein [Xanthomonas]|uniref:hypothetical protein n=1 Tax=Xanthomonas TaxID=338 RepID=UPI0005283AF5|nr:MULTISPECIES: hypothetical protein [Xanthomonas]OOW89000.1 hypothetical protein Xvtf_11020 [Xanthomonas campestris pv. vitistrifoliae]OOW92045.1 hypothetical protein Xvtr_16325 [Xanthomonas campestris pv. vitiscarnosae]MBE0316887.1 hypothetical protein [Xanthomonas citri pv. punicae]MDS0759593.1 hypothetical protein [Xanthomonas citri pv. punicae]MDS0763369.1 hypothetical protein [Xanthomonas citri pv. punicae]
MSQASRIVYYSNKNQRGGRFFIPANDPVKNKSTGGVIGFSCAALLGVAFTGGVAAGQAAPTSPIVQPDIKATPVLSKSKREAGGTNSDTDSVPPSQLVQDLEWVKAQADVSVSALASLFDVTRKTFYGWMSGEVSPRPHRVIRVSALRAALASLSTREERNAVFGLLDRRVGAGTTIREMLASKEEDGNVLDQLTDALQELDPQIQKAAERATRTGTRSRAFEVNFPVA